MSDDSSKKSYLPHSKTCYVCGEENIAGFRLRFFVDGARVLTVFNAEPHHCGYVNVVHGGVVAALLDETLGWAANRAIARMCVTGDLNVRYIKPVPGDRTLTVWAEVLRSGRRLVHVHGAIEDDNGDVFARAEARFLPMTAEETRMIDQHLVYGDDAVRVFDEAYEQRNDA